MNSQIIGLRVAGTIFGLMGLGQLARLLYPPRNPCGRLPDAIVAEHGGRSDFRRNEHLAVEALLRYL